MVYLGSETVCPEKDRQAVFIHPCIFTIIIHVRIFGQTNQTIIQFLGGKPLSSFIFRHCVCLCDILYDLPEK